MPGPGPVVVAVSGDQRRDAPDDDLVIRSGRRVRLAGQRVEFGERVVPPALLERQLAGHQDIGGQARRAGPLAQHAGGPQRPRGLVETVQVAQGRDLFGVQHQA